MSLVGDRTVVPRPGRGHESDEGTGRLYRRRYSVEFATDLPPERVLARVGAAFPALSPALLAAFHRRGGRPEELAVGDEMGIRVMGVRTAVRAMRVEPRGFVLATRDDHPEAGRIEFRVEPVDGPDDRIRFVIESWARSRNGLVVVAYTVLRVGMVAQRLTWTTFCRRVVALNGGRERSRVQVTTHPADVPPA